MRRGSQERASYTVGMMDEEEVAAPQRYGYLRKGLQSRRYRRRLRRRQSILQILKRHKVKLAVSNFRAIRLSGNRKR